MESENRTNGDQWNATDAVVVAVYWKDVSVFTARLARKLGTSCLQGQSFCPVSRTYVV